MILHAGPRAPGPTRRPGPGPRGRLFPARGSSAAGLVLLTIALGAPARAIAQEGSGSGHAVEALGWLAGCWRAMGARTVMEEHWTAPAGGTMLGLNRSVRDGRTTAHEFLSLEVRPEGALVYAARPSGQAYTEFRATAVDADGAVFENPDHDFPRRIRYRRRGPDSLVVRIDDGEGESAVDFAFARAPCPGDPGS